MTAAGRTARSQRSLTTGRQARAITTFTIGWRYKGQLAIVDDVKLPATLREPTFLVLAALGPAPMHGYGIIKAVEEMSEGRVRLRAGTLYGALERLESQGFVAFDREASEGGPARRYYKLTQEGKSLLALEAARLASNARLAFAQLGITP